MCGGSGDDGPGDAPVESRGPSGDDAGRAFFVWEGKSVDVVGDTIAAVIHSGGTTNAEHGVIVDTVAIRLASGRTIGLTENGVISTGAASLHPDPKFQSRTGLRIVGIEHQEHWPTCGLRLSDGSALVMGTPAPYCWGLVCE